MSDVPEPRPRLIAMGGNDLGDCPVCGYVYRVNYGPDRVEIAHRCHCPSGAPDNVLGFALLVSAGLEPFPTEEISWGTFGWDGKIRWPTIDDAPEGEGA